MHTLIFSTPILVAGTIRGGATSNALMGTRNQQLSTLWSKIVSHDGMVETTEEGNKLLSHFLYQTLFHYQNSSCQSAMIHTFFVFL